jgi:non-canonical (house-cleaning) NTP pyrophosphatase
MDALSGEQDTKNRQGTVGILTNNAVQRADAFERAVVFALAKFISPYYG